MVEQAITPLSLTPPSAAMAAPPVSHEQYQADMAVLREQIATVRTAASVEQMVQLGMPVQETTAKLAQQFIISIATIEEKMTTMEGTTAQALANIQAIVQAATAQATPLERKM